MLDNAERWLVAAAAAAAAATRANYRNQTTNRTAMIRARVIILLSNVTSAYLSRPEVQTRRRGNRARVHLPLTFVAYRRACRLSRRDDDCGALVCDGL
jgi:hypothetical protein